ncbi:hypothetical protein MJD09_15270 [bacterium]|nr:hypothetical protein [bacterium]
MAAHQEQRDALIDYYNQVRRAVKLHSRRWDMNDRAARNQVYRLLYGMRAAVEEVLLAAPELQFEPAMQVEAVASAVPSTKILGIQVHSGDLDRPTSAVASPGPTAPAKTGRRSKPAPITPSSKAKAGPRRRPTKLAFFHFRKQNRPQPRLRPPSSPRSRSRMRWSPSRP